jgi:cytochrome c oxidase subunit I
MATQTHSPAHHDHHDVDYLNDGHSISSWLLTLDHKRIALLYLYTTIGLFLVGGIFALLVRLELMYPGQTIMTADQYNRAFTFHGGIMVFMFIIPSIPGALGNFLLPLMLGAKDVAFPRLNLLSWYIFILGVCVALYGLLAGNGADTGWTFYTPYSIRTGTSVIAMVAGAFIMGFASILTGLNFIATIHKLRAPGMTFFRMPLFVWAIYATSIIQVLATPVLAITLLLLMMERFLGIGFFDPTLGGDPVLFQHFFWFYSHPAVYIMILPGMGIISEMIPPMAHKPIFGYRAIAYSTLAIALISFIVWGHHMFVSGQSEWASFVFSVLTMLVAIPTAIKVFNWSATLYKGSISWATPMLFCFSFLFMFSIGGLTGVFLGALSVDVHLTDTYFVVAHFHYVMMGGTVMAYFGGLHYWFPKIFGRMYNEMAGKITWFLTFVGFNMTFLPQFWLGSAGMPRRYYDYAPQYSQLNLVSTVGSWFIAAGVLVMLINLVYSRFKGAKAPQNPWGALTLEWTHAASPPITHNFHDQPVVTEWPYEYKSKRVGIAQGGH